MKSSEKVFYQSNASWKPSIQNQIVEPLVDTKILWDSWDYKQLVQGSVCVSSNSHHIVSLNSALNAKISKLWCQNTSRPCSYRKNAFSHNKSGEERLTIIRPQRVTVLIHTLFPVGLCRSFHHECHFFPRRQNLMLAIKSKVTCVTTIEPTATILCQ